VRLLFAVVVLRGLFAPAIASAAVAPADAPTVTPADAATVTAAPAARHPNPRLKLSYRSFGLTSFDGTSVGLKGAQLDAYPISRRYFRLGLELEGGGGDTAINGGTANLWYGLFGVGAGFQYPARVTPFVEGRIAAGALGGRYSGPLAQVGGVTLGAQTASTATFLYVGGIDAGVEVYAVSRFYVSAAIGWAHPVFTGPDVAAMTQNPTGGLVTRQIASDSFTFKIGVGL